MPIGLDNAYFTKNHVINSMHWPCGLGYQFLGPSHYACGGNNFCHNLLLWAGSCPAQILFYRAWERMIAQYPPATSMAHCSEPKLGVQATISTSHQQTTLKLAELPCANKTIYAISSSDSEKVSSETWPKKDGSTTRVYNLGATIDEIIPAQFVSGNKSLFLCKQS